ncbi:MAG: 2-oxo acid dehydrogenase subunit E2 [Bdellovibrionaceae bacterium]|nr:2-oxo acid dehydrogenase subunit E2 [Bdellovibrionales bacterium]MCB9086380.1 2-oxo acid dehydrogenase subunit E2 [Pseudobdellovibrionaceae bacterium]
MATQEVNLPDIGEGVTEGELVKWLVKPGDKVEPDQPVAEVMTDKATVEVPTPVAGVVKELLRQEGDIIPIETAMLVLETDGAAKTAPAPKHEEPKPAPAMAAASGPAPTAAVVARPTPTSGGMEVYPPAASSKILATPGTRRLAREFGVDINNLPGTGPLGRVTREDVIRAKDLSSGLGATVAGRPTMQMPPKVAYQGAGGEMEERVPLRGIRKKIAENLQMAKQIVPHFTLMEEVNVTELVHFRNQAKEAGEKAGVKVTYLPFVMKALIATIREFPMFNASIDDAAGEIVYKKYFNLGFAADTPNGLLVPVVKNADQKTIIEMSRDIKDLALKARDGKLALDEMKGATITITNIGSVGGVYATPIINHPEVAILGMYKITERPIWVDGEWWPAQFMNFTITCDHRLIDGAVAANFMKAFATRIENPSTLMLDMM